VAKILVAEDDEQVRGMLHQMLERAGHDVAVARDGRQAVKMYRREPADVMITDMAMPKKHGYEAIRELKERFPDLKSIAITGWGSELLDLADSNGASLTMAKPVGQAELLQAVDDLLGDPDQ
jgi:CheY-like chemotaxis protein